MATRRSKKVKLIVPILISFVAVMGLLFYQFGQSQEEGLTFVFCDVGQGDAIYIRYEGKDIIIDGGPDGSVMECLSRHMPLFDRTIELMVVTHADSDHYNGFNDVLEVYSVQSFATSPGDSEVESYVELTEKLTASGLTPRRLTQGDRIKIGELTIDVLWPPEAFTKIDDDRNNSSLVMLVDYKDFETILTGDLDREYLNLLLDDLNQVEVFKLAHHGSRTSADMNTFKSFRPELSVISAGEDNRFGHPHAEVIDVLNSYDLNYDTTFDGDIVLRSDGQEWQRE